MPKICILKLEHRCGGYECDPEAVQDSDWFEVTESELTYLNSAIHDYSSPIFNHVIVIKPELDIESLKLKSKEYYEKIIASEKKKAEAKIKKEKKRTIWMLPRCWPRRERSWNNSDWNLEIWQTPNK
mgnify:CR=1 FL=1